MRFNVRPATANDARQVAAIYAPVVETTHISFEEIAPTEAEMRARVEGIRERLPWLVADTGEVVGYAYASEHARAPGIVGRRTSRFTSPHVRGTAESDVRSTTRSWKF